MREVENSKLKELIVTDSIPQKKESKKVNVLTCANYLQMLCKTLIIINQLILFLLNNNYEINHNQRI